MAEETTTLLNPLDYMTFRILADFIESGEPEYIITPNKEIPLSPWYNHKETVKSNWKKKINGS